MLWYAVVLACRVCGTFCRDELELGCSAGAYWEGLGLWQFSRASCHCSFLENCFVVLQIEMISESGPENILFLGAMSSR